MARSIARALGLALCLVHPRAGEGGFTEPTLALAAASGVVAGEARAAVLEGSFDFPNAIQLGYPLQLAVFQGDRFARYPVSGGAPVTGVSAALADGVLSQDELPAFVAAGSPAPPAVRILTIAPDRLRVALPPTFTAGPTTALLFTILQNASVLSNPIDFTLP
jgi:hypothetical protein